MSFRTIEKRYTLSRLSCTRTDMWTSELEPKTHSFLRGKGKSNFEAKQTPPCFCFLALLLLEAFWYLPNVIFSPNNTSLLIGNILEILHLSVLDWSWERWVFWILYWRFLALALEVWLDWWWVSSCSSIQSPKKWRWALKSAKFLFDLLCEDLLKHWRIVGLLRWYMQEYDAKEKSSIIFFLCQMSSIFVPVLFLDIHWTGYLYSHMGNEKLWILQFQCYIWVHIF